MLPNLPILDYDRRAAEWHARERARLEAAGSPAPFVDAQIAAIAFHAAPAVEGHGKSIRHLKQFVKKHTAIQDQLCLG